MILVLVLIPLAGCSNSNSFSQGTQAGQNGENPGGFSGKRHRSSSEGGNGSPMTAGGTNGQGASGGSSQNQLYGKVTSIVGNEVTLAIGTMATGQETSGGNSTAQGSSGFTPTGETKTLLIPVGLTLSGSAVRTAGGFGGTGTQGQSGAAESTPAQNGLFGGNTGGNTNTTAAGGSTGMTRSTRTSAAGTRIAGTTGTAGTAGSARRSGDFSSITKGMVLRITQRDVNGTMTVVRVSVVSK